MTNLRNTLTNLNTAQDVNTAIALLGDCKLRNQLNGIVAQYKNNEQELLRIAKNKANSYVYEVWTKSEVANCPITIVCNNLYFCISDDANRAKRRAEDVEAQKLGYKNHSEMERILRDEKIMAKYKKEDDAVANNLKALPQTIEHDGVIYIAKDCVVSRRGKFVTVLTGEKIAKTENIQIVSMTRYMTIAQNLAEEIPITGSHLAFQVLPIPVRCLGRPAHVSKSGSKYYDTVWGKIRVSNHWGRVGTSVYELYAGEWQLNQLKFTREVIAINI